MERTLQFTQCFTYTNLISPTHQPPEIKITVWLHLLSQPPCKNPTVGTNFFKSTNHLFHWQWGREGVKVTQLCPTLWDRMDYTIHGILQPRGSSQPRDQTQVSRVAGGFLTSRATREALITHLVKNPLAMRETRVQLLGPKDPLEKGMATHSSILAWSIPWTEEPGGL